MAEPKNPPQQPSVSGQPPAPNRLLSLPAMLREAYGIRPFFSGARGKAIMGLLGAAVVGLIVYVTGAYKPVIDYFSSQPSQNPAQEEVAANYSSPNQDIIVPGSMSQLEAESVAPEASRDVVAQGSDITSKLYDAAPQAAEPAAVQPQNVAYAKPADAVQAVQTAPKVDINPADVTPYVPEAKSEPKTEPQTKPEVKEPVVPVVDVAALVDRYFAEAKPRFVLGPKDRASFSKLNHDCVFGFEQFLYPTDFDTRSYDMKDLDAHGRACASRLKGDLTAMGYQVEQVVSDQGVVAYDRVMQNGAPVAKLKLDYSQ